MTPVDGAFKASPPRLGSIASHFTVHEKTIMLLTAKRDCYLGCTLHRPPPIFRESIVSWMPPVVTQRAEHALAPLLPDLCDSRLGLQHRHELPSY